MLMVVLAGSAGAQTHTMGTVDPNHVEVAPRTPLEKQLQREIVCICGTCGHQNLAECKKDPCATSIAMRAELSTLIKENKSHDEIIDWFIAKYGSQEVLGAPIDKGFNRLAWLFPYLVGATSAIAVGFVAVKWTRKPETPTEAAPLDAALEERIDDELRDLD
jgi:cytochrome c-type biogenesis protein CcmH/NrfF